MNTDARVRTVVVYESPSGKSPFSDWFNALKDRRAKATIDARLTRVRNGNFGSCRSLKGGVWELKIDLGPGYRIYFGLYGDTIVVLLNGGDKGTQDRDIKRAQEFWSEYLNDQRLT